jgi:hypothetical protein
MRGEQKETFTVWFHLDQRTLQYETYVMPAPIENHAELYEHLLRRNLKLYGAAFAIGDEDAVFLVGQLGVHAVDRGEFDRLLGSIYQWVEQFSARHAHRLRQRLPRPGAVVPQRRGCE